MASSVEDICKTKRAHGSANVLAIATATPSNCFYQADYPEYFFGVTIDDHMKELKAKFKRMCQKSMIRKRYMRLTEEMIKAKPQDIVIEEVPKLGEKAALEGIEEWCQPKSNITHLVFCTTSGSCYGGGTVLRLAKDVAENNAGARVWVICREITAITFLGPDKTQLGCHVGQALFGDGITAPNLSIERPIFKLVCAKQVIIPFTEQAKEGFLSEMGLLVNLSEDVPHFISSNIEKCLSDAFKPIGIKDWSSLFWVDHAGGGANVAILDSDEEKLDLEKQIFNVTRHMPHFWAIME